MRILEVRDGFIKFESNENIALSSFVEVGGFAVSYIAQVIKTSKINDQFIELFSIMASKITLSLAIINYQRRSFRAPFVFL